MLAEETGRRWQPPSHLDPKAERESKTARIIAISIIGLLGVALVLDFGSTAVLASYNRLDAEPFFERRFNTWLPLLSGLAASAITFYLTKEKK